MALTFPLSFAQFVSLLPIRRLSLDLPEQVTLSRTRGGEILQAERGARLWQAEIELDQMRADEAAAVMPLINLLRGAGASFLLSDPARPRPRADATGTNPLSAVKINSAGTRELTLSGLPASYTLKSGDLISWTYGTSPVRHALHEVINPSVSANASGVTGAIEVTPPIRPGVTGGAAVRLLTPWCKAIIVPGSVSPGQRRAGGILEGVKFRTQQTLR